MLLKELKKADFGIVCLTKDNIQSPWLLFEAGAIARSFDSIESRVGTLLIGDLANPDLDQPLANFQSTILKDKDEVLKLLITINKYFKEQNLPEDILKKSFDKWWPDFEKNFTEAITSAPVSTHEPIRRDDRELLEELIDLSRSNTKILDPMAEAIVDIYNRPYYQPRSYTVVEGHDGTTVAWNAPSGALPHQALPFPVGKRGLSTIIVSDKAGTISSTNSNSDPTEDDKNEK